MKENEEIKHNIIQFLKLCINYTNDSLERKSKRLDDLTPEDLENATQEIEKWKNYKEFTEYTIKELSNGELDEWINRLNDPEFKPGPE
jgi:hypothetical protein